MSNYILIHSAKGIKWKDHKYIAIKNGRYIYPEDLEKKDATSYYSKNYQKPSITPPPIFTRPVTTNTGGTFTAMKFKTTKSTENRNVDLKNAMQTINQKYKGTMNCTACTAALDYLLRNKDRNIKVDVPDFDGAYMTQIADLYKTKDGKKPKFTETGLVHSTDEGDFYNMDPNFYRTYNPRKVASEAINDIARQGDGARGHMIVSFLGEYSDGLMPYGSHDVMYYVQKGKVYIFDGQSNQSFTAEEFFNKKLGRDVNGAPVYRHLTNYLRTDNLDINYKNDFYKSKLAVGPERARENNIIRQRVKKTPKEEFKLTLKGITNAIKDLGRGFIKALFGKK